MWFLETEHYIDRFVESNRGLYSHNLYASVIAETGIVGAMMFILSIILFPLYRLQKQLKHDQLAKYGYTIFAVFVLVGLAYMHRISDVSTSAFFGIALAMIQQKKRPLV